jgi:hypothetical protein
VLSQSCSLMKKHGLAYRTLNRETAGNQVQAQYVDAETGGADRR